ncbi:MAG: diguanylate cyclase [Anaerolineales bacterium]|nr:diguanylate cyclase [Anaerolineales bacterium]
MPPPNTIYSTLLLIAGTICIFVAVLIIQTRRTATGALTLISLLLALAWWDITYAILWAGAPAPSQYFWLDLTYLGAVTVPAALFLFSLHITNHQEWLKRPLAALIYLEPIFVLICLFTDSHHGLFFAGKRMENSAVILDGGPVFWFNLVYSYVLILFSTAIIIRAYIRASGIYRKQLIVILAGIAFTWLNSIILISGFSLLKDADNTPFSFTISAIAFAFAVGKYHLLDLIPIARDSLIEKMTDGVLVIDPHNRIVDMNPAAQNLLKVDSSVLGKPVEETIKKWHRYQKDSLNFTQIQTEIELDGKQKKHIDMQVTPIMDSKGKKFGQLIILHDITKLKNVQNELHLLANSDSLTGAVSRGHFMELANSEIQRAIRYKRNFSLILMDMDCFKKVNDTYGHASGDQALITLKKICEHDLRKMDIFARLGGEEFALLLPETSQKIAAALAERLRASLESTNIQADSSKFKVTISMGVAEFRGQRPDTLEALFHRADKALYKAKSDGRNRVVIWKPKMG